jgi:hypothetical protein
MIRKPKRKSKKKDFKRATYVDALDSVFSHYIRQKAADDDGMVGCFTCTAIGHWKTMQCGHYFSRKSLSTRWDERNVRVQDMHCNVFIGGNYPVFGVRLAQEIGADGMAELERLNKQVVKLDNNELVAKIRMYYLQLRWPDEISLTLRKQLKQLKII